jgi:hypothetical protein
MQQSPVTTSADKVSGARSGRLRHRPMEVGLSRWLREIHERWLDSKQRIVADEFCKIPRRISAIWADSCLRFGPAIPNDPRRTSPPSSPEESIFLFACSEGMKQLSQRHVWMGSLDQQLAGEAFQMGAAWAFRTQGSCKREGDTAQNHSSDKFS